MSGVPTTAVFIFGIVLLPSLAHAQQTQPPPPLSSPQAAADPADEFSGRDPLELGDARAAAAPTADAAKTDPLALADSPAETDNALSVEAWKLIDWVLATHDNNDMPFMVIDKVAAEAIAFNSVGERIGVSPALVGMAVGDDETPAVGDREMTAIPLKARMTPAGRFVGRIGPAVGHSDVLWIDYPSAISLHGVITLPGQHRQERLKSRTPDDNRITYGCINVPKDFYAKVVKPLFKGTDGIVYVLPETKPLNAVFMAMPPAAEQQANAASQ